jgi:hypothetical protein
MKIYSNQLIPWPRILHVTQNSRIAPGLKWLNYNIYQIKSVYPLHISTNSSLSLLTKDRRYACYDEYIIYPYYTPYCEKRIISPKNNEQMSVYIPYDIRPYDIIVIQDDYTNMYGSPYYKK